jgi:hypothetical protein
MITALLLQAVASAVNTVNHRQTCDMIHIDMIHIDMIHIDTIHIDMIHAQGHEAASHTKFNQVNVCLCSFPPFVWAACISPQFAAALTMPIASVVHNGKIQLNYSYMFGPIINRLDR